MATRSVRLAVETSRREPRGQQALLVGHLREDRQIVGIHRPRLDVDRARGTCVGGLSHQLGKRHMLLVLVHHDLEKRAVFAGPLWPRRDDNGRRIAWNSRYGLLG